MHVVVAAHQHPFDGRLAQCGKAFQQCRPARLASVQEVAEKNQTLRPGLCEQPLEALERLAGGARRHGDAMCAEGCGLAEMCIGHQQGAACWPPQRAFGKQHDPFAGYRQLMHVETSCRALRHSG
jgi:hypothetical protein